MTGNQECNIDKFWIFSLFCLSIWYCCVRLLYLGFKNSKRFSVTDEVEKIDEKGRVQAIIRANMRFKTVKEIRNKTQHVKNKSRA